jgi:hypothetical protein
MTNELQPLAALCMDGCFAGLSSLLLSQLVLTQHPFACAVRSSLRRSRNHHSGRSNR